MILSDTRILETGFITGEDNAMPDAEAFMEDGLFL